MILRLPPWITAAACRKKHRWFRNHKSWAVVHALATIERTDPHINSISDGRNSPIHMAVLIMTTSIARLYINIKKMVSSFSLNMCIRRWQIRLIQWRNWLYTIILPTLVYYVTQGSSTCVFNRHSKDNICAKMITCVDHTWAIFWNRESC